MGVENWIHDSSDTKGKGPGRPADGLRLNADVENANRDAELRAQYVVVAPGDEAKPISRRSWRMTGLRTLAMIESIL